jgi:hypothetical protein
VALALVSSVDAAGLTVTMLVDGLSVTTLVAVRVTIGVLVGRKSVASVVDEPSTLNG